MRSPIRKIAFAAVIAAVYAALTMLLAPISYGVLQFRISEALCILPFFFPVSVWGLFVGCAIANTISLLGPVDIVCGSAATLLAALCTAYIGKRSKSVPACILGCLPPVVFNGIIIGAMLAVITAPEGGFWAGLLAFGGQVALEELAVMLVIGLPVMLWMRKNRAFTDMIEKLRD